MSQSWRARGIACLAVLVMCAATVYVAAQAVTTGVIEGRVADESGAVVPGATLTLRNTTRNTLATQVSGANGDYRFLAVQVGSYELRAELAGFGTVTMLVGTKPE